MLPVPLVVNLVVRSAKMSLPELRRRTAPPHRACRRPHRFLADRTALVSLVVARATSWCRSRTKSSPPARLRGAPMRPPPSAAVHRCPPPSVVAMRPQPPDLDLTALIDPTATV
jgi:hypothetical protein